MRGKQFEDDDPGLFALKAVDGVSFECGDIPLWLLQTQAASCSLVDLMLAYVESHDSNLTGRHAMDDASGDTLRSQLSVEADGALYLIRVHASRDPRRQFSRKQQLNIDDTGLDEFYLCRLGLGVTGSGAFSPHCLRRITVEE